MMPDRVAATIAVSGASSVRLSVVFEPAKQQTVVEQLAQAREQARIAANQAVVEPTAVRTAEAAQHVSGKNNGGS